MQVQKIIIIALCKCKIIYLDSKNRYRELDDVLNEEYQHPRKLVMYVKERITDNKNYYVFINEVQMMDNFVGALNSLLHIENADVYVTGSNSKFLSSDIATEFRGLRLYILRIL